MSKVVRGVWGPLALALAGCATISDAHHQQRLDELAALDDEKERPDDEDPDPDDEDPDDPTGCEETDPDRPTWYPDEDGDGWGAEGPVVQACEEPEGYAARDGDCDDTNAEIHPETEWYLDQDGDGYGDPAAPAGVSCEAPEGAVPNALDCDDADGAVHPGAPEICDGIDNDCDPSTGEAGLVSLRGEGQPSLAAAVDAAETGDEILVCEGEHPVSAVLDDIVLKIRGIGGRELVTLVPGAGDSHFVMGGGATLGLTSLTVSDATYGAIDAFSATRIELRDVVFRNNDAGVGPGGQKNDGGAIRAYYTQVFAEDSLFEGNSGGSGGAIHSAAALQLTDVELRENQATQNGGAINHTDGHFTLVRGLLVGNQAALDGGALNIGAFLQHVTVEHSELRENHAARGGAIHSGALTSENNGYFNNTATQEGGAVRAQSPLFQGDEFAENEAARGGAVYAFHGATQPSALTSQSSTYRQNIALQGGAIYAHQLASVDDDFEENGAGGSVPDATGGALRLGAGESTVHDSRFSGNTSGEGGAIWASGRLALEGVHVEGNQAAAGGAIALGAGGDLVVTGANFLGGNSSLRGGTFFLREGSVARVWATPAAPVNLHSNALFDGVLGGDDPLADDNHSWPDPIDTVLSCTHNAHGKDCIFPEESGDP